MIRASWDDFNLLINDLREKGFWIPAYLLLRDDRSEEHKFWAKLGPLTKEKLVLSGEFSQIGIPLDSDVVFGYMEVSECPSFLRPFLNVCNSFLIIRSQRVEAFIGGGGPKNE
jgi:hypothetical protein